MTRKTDEREERLKVLTEAHGVPGYQAEIRLLLRDFCAFVIPDSIIHRDGYDNALKLLTAVVARLDAETVAGLTT
jgi:putative aminopeptidase FrvX